MSPLTFPVQNLEQGRPPLLGLARLMRLVYTGADIAPLGIEMIERIGADPGDTNALMDLATLMYLDFAPELAADFQRQALVQQRHYRLAASAERLRLLMLMTPGNLMANAPLEFLVKDSDITLEMLYIAPGEPLPAPLPEHDLLWVAINECDAVQPLLRQLAMDLEAWPRPVINCPAGIAELARDRAGGKLKDIPGLVAPRSVRIDQARLRRIGSGVSMEEIDCDLAFPLIVRPVGSHAGQGLARLDDPSAIADYLQGRGEDEYYLTPYVDYRGGDGLFRKYRIALIDGRPYACHMAVSDYWVVHYLNAGMADSAEKRAEEAGFMAGFNADFGRRHAAALREIHRRTALDYLIIDCAETPQGELLVFEVDSGAVVHDLDPAEVFPYKRPQMSHVFAAFREMVFRRAQHRGRRS